MLPEKTAGGAYFGGKGAPAPFRRVGRAKRNPSQGGEERS
jgi:hypothetical protein